jgi:hypothetical protein
VMAISTRASSAAPAFSELMTKAIDRMGFMSLGASPKNG